MRSFEDYEKMAMLELSEAEREEIKSRFDTIVNGFSALDMYNTEGVEPLVSVLDLKNILREDITAKHISKKELMKNAPQQHDGYFQVPAAI